jgi:hypothetical protein
MLQHTTYPSLPNDRHNRTPPPSLQSPSTNPQRASSLATKPLAQARVVTGLASPAHGSPSRGSHMLWAVSSRRWSPSPQSRRDVVGVHKMGRERGPGPVGRGRALAFSAEIERERKRRGQASTSLFAVRNRTGTGTGAGLRKMGANAGGAYESFETEKQDWTSYSDGHTRARESGDSVSSSPSSSSPVSSSFSPPFPTPSQIIERTAHAT